MRSSNVPVLVVGAGPTGLTLAAQLAARGICHRIVDSNAGRVTESRALAIQPKSLEIFRRMGIAEELHRRGQRIHSVRIWVGGRSVGGLDLSDLGYDDTPYPYPLFVSQAVTEEALEARLEALGSLVERSTELTALEPAADSVTATLQGQSGIETVTANWVVGSDGAHSRVRKEIGLSFAGAPYPQEFVLADVAVDWSEPADRLQVFLSRAGLLVVFPLAGDGRLRIIASRAGAGSEDRSPLGLGEVQELTDRLAPLPMRLCDPEWLTRFSLHHRGVDRYRVGRVFVAGDAAHIHSPAGGQGMNTGIQDADNLAWKLALVVGGKARAEPLLASYHDERWPIGRNLLRFTDRLFQLMVTRSRSLRLLRSLVLPALLPLATGSRERQGRLFRFVSQLGIRYPKSPIVGESPAGAAGFSKREGPRPGDRAPDVVVRDGPRGGGRLFDRLVGPGFHLLAFSGLPPWTAVADAVTAEAERGGRPLGDLVTVHRVQGDVEVAQGPSSGSMISDVGGGIHRRYGFDRPGLVLIRPDGHVGFRVAGLSGEALAEHLLGLLGTEPPAAETSL